jgi:5-bromo-4-chloroindolyl phosphate hydrolysis protein
MLNNLENKKSTIIDWRKLSSNAKALEKNKENKDSLAIVSFLKVLK